MKWQRFFLILLFIPHLIFGFDENYCNTLCNQNKIYWQDHNTYIEDFKKRDPIDAEGRLELLNKSLTCCQQALVNCDTVINDVDSKSEKQKKSWCYKVRSVCSTDKHNLKLEIAILEPAIRDLENQIRIMRQIGVVFILFLFSQMFQNVCFVVRDFVLLQLDISKILGLHFWLFFLQKVKYYIGVIVVAQPMSKMLF